MPLINDSINRYFFLNILIMKQLFRFSLLLLAILLPALATAHNFEVDGIYYNINGNEATVTFKGLYYSDYYDEYSGSVVIPATVTYNGTTYSVTAIGENAFSKCTGLTSVVIPNSVTEIGGEAFWSCTGLTSIDIPNSVTKIGGGAFEGCTGLTSIVIPNSVTHLGSYAFDGCTGLTSIVIPNSITTIGIYTFYRCTGLTSIVIPNSVTTIGNWAFEQCTGLTSIDIPNSVTEIGYGAFYRCTGLTGIVVESGNPRYDSRNSCNAIIETASNTLIVGCNNTMIPNSVTAIGDNAFSCCTGLTSVNIPNSVTTIGEKAFEQCTGLTSIVIPNSVTAIGLTAFNGCTGLTSIVIPNSVTDIGEGAFNRCTGLTSIVVESGNPRYDSRNKCNAIIETANNTLIYGCNNTMIPNSVTAIGTDAFARLTGLTSIIIPNSVYSIGFWAFYGCTGLTDMYCYIADPSRVLMEFGQFDLDDGDYSGRTLHVLQGTAGAYRANGNWFPYFGQIVEDLFMGDVNCDLEINIADVNAVIDIILSGNGNASAADVNGDGEINIADVNALINIILSGNQN